MAMEEEKILLKATKNQTKVKVTITTMVLDAMDLT
jgi:hypothetical protein